MNLTRVKSQKTKHREQASAAVAPAPAPPPAVTVSKPKDGYFWAGEGWHSYRNILDYEVEAFDEAFGPHRLVDIKDRPGEKGYAWDVPDNQAAWKKVKKWAQCCAYDAVNDFLYHILGKKMDGADKDWYESHPKTTSHGLPYEFTITVLNDLVRPYGAGVSRVVARKGISLTDEQRAWLAVLGSNPAALMDRSTSNAEYLSRFNSLPDALRKKYEAEADAYRFEFTDRLPPGPWVTFGNVAVGTMGATGGGHAAYRGPRSTVDGWALALQLDWIERIPYQNQAEPPTLEYEAVSVLDFDLQASTSPTGEKVSAIIARHRPSYKSSSAQSLPPGVNGFGKPISGAYTPPMFNDYGDFSE